MDNKKIIELLMQRGRLMTRPEPFEEERQKGIKTWLSRDDYKIVPEGTPGAFQTRIIWRDPKSKFVECEPDLPGAIPYRRFWGYVSTEKPDWYNTIVERDAVVDAWPDYMVHGNIRLMHSNRAIGRVFQDDYEIRDKGVYAGANIPLYNTDVLKDIDAGILQSFSLGWDSKPGGIKWAETPNDYTRFTDIKIGEVTICDSGATPDTEISQERNLISTLFQRVRKLFTEIIGSSTNTGESPEEEIEMNSEEMKALLKEQEKSLTAGIVSGISGALEAVFSRIQKPQEAPKEPEKPKQPESVPAGLTLDSIKQVVSETVKPLADRMDGFERAITTHEPLGGSLTELEKGTKELEAMVDDLQKNPAAVPPDLGLSFIRCKDGAPLTISRLKARDPE